MNLCRMNQLCIHPLCLLMLGYLSFYYPFTDLYIPKFKIYNFEWIRTYLRLVLN